MAEDAPQKSWQSRIAESTDAIAQSFVESISYDRRLYKHDVAGSIAHATMLEKVGLITGFEREAIEVGLRSIEKDIEAGHFVFDEAMEDIHMVVEAELIKRIGEPGRKLHTGRSRNDQVALDLRLWLGDSARVIEKVIEVLCRSFVGLAERSRDVVMPSFTHLQSAITHRAGAQRLGLGPRSAGSTAFFTQFIGGESPLGSGAIAGTSLQLDPEFSVEQLRGTVTRIDGSVHEHQYFNAGPSNEIYHTATRDEACRFTFHLAMISQHLSRWAEQWIIYMTTEFGFIKIADRYTTSSSMMPQKRSLDMLELIRGRCGNVYGDLFALATILKGLPIGYNRDLQEDKRIVFRATTPSAVASRWPPPSSTAPAMTRTASSPRSTAASSTPPRWPNTSSRKASRSARPITSSARSSPAARRKATTPWHAQRRRL